MRYLSQTIFKSNKTIMAPPDLLVSKVEFLPFLYTARLTLRLYDDQRDVPFATSLFGPSFTAEDMQRLDKGTQLRKSLLNGRKAPGASAYIIHLGTAEGPEIGVVSLCHRKEGLAPDIGWGVSVENRRKGLATEAAKECLRYWHEEFGLKEICAFVSKDNIASQRVVERVGLVSKGYLTLTGMSGSVYEVFAYGLGTMNEFQGDSVNFWGEPEEEDKDKE